MIKWSLKNVKKTDGKECEGLVISYYEKRPLLKTLQEFEWFSRNVEELDVPYQIVFEGN